jgi:RNA-binding protein YlmH
MEHFTLDIGEDVIANKGHLLRVLCDSTGLKKRSFGDLVIDKKKSRISVDKQSAEYFKQSFKGTKLGGKKITVIRDK